MNAAGTRPADSEPSAISGPPAPGSAGVVVRFDEAAARAAQIPHLAWIPATIARRVAFATATTTLGASDGISLGLAHVEGRLLTMVALGEAGPHAPVVLCARSESEIIAVAVAQIVASGRFDHAGPNERDGDVEADGDAGGAGVVTVSGERARPLDIVAVTSRLEAAFWIVDATPERASLVPRSRKT